MRRRVGAMMSHDHCMPKDEQAGSLSDASTKLIDDLHEHVYQSMSHRRHGFGVLLKSVITHNLYNAICIDHMQWPMQKTW